MAAPRRARSARSTGPPGVGAPPRTGSPRIGQGGSPGRAAGSAAVTHRVPPWLSPATGEKELQTGSSSRVYWRDSPQDGSLHAAPATPVVCDRQQHRAPATPVVCDRQWHRAPATKVRPEGQIRGYPASSDGAPSWPRAALASAARCGRARPGNGAHVASTRAPPWPRSGRRRSARRGLVGVELLLQRPWDARACAAFFVDGA